MIPEDASEIASSRGVYFFGAVAGYALHGWRRDTTNQFHPPTWGLHPFMVALIVTEIGGWLILVAGFIDAQIL